MSNNSNNNGCNPYLEAARKILQTYQLQQRKNKRAKEEIKEIILTVLNLILVGLPKEKIVLIFPESRKSEVERIIDQQLMNKEQLYPKRLIHSLWFKEIVNLPRHWLKIERGKQN